MKTSESRTSWPNYEEIRDRGVAAAIFADVAAHRNFIAALTTTGAPVQLMGEMTSANFFDVLATGRSRDPRDLGCDRGEFIPRAARSQSGSGRHAADV